MPAGTLETLAKHLGLALGPLESQLTSDNIIPFLAEMGLQFPPNLLQPNFKNAVNAGATAAGKLPATLTDLATAVENDDESAMLAKGVQLLQEVSAVILALEQIGTELNNLSGSLPGMNPAEVATFAANFSGNLLSYLLISYLEGLEPAIAGVANLLGVVDYIPQEGTMGDPTHPPFITRKLQLSKFGKAVSAPKDILKDLYNWGDPSFDAAVLMSRLKSSMGLFGILPDPEAPPLPADSLPLALVSFRGNPASNPPGLIAALTYDLPEDFTFSIPLSETWSLDLSLKANLDAGLEVTVTPPLDIVFSPPTGSVDGTFKIDLTGKGKDASHPLIIFGQTGASRLQTDSFSFGAGLTFRWNSVTGKANADPLVEASVTGGRLVVDASQGDGFLAKILSGIKIDAPFDLGFTWSISGGVQFKGSGMLEIEIPLNLSLGPINFIKAHLGAGFKDGAVPIELSAAISAEIGPVSAAVDRLGLTATFSFPNGGGNLGPAQLDMAFKPPTGVGLAVSAGPIQGGGYIFFDQPNGRYGGIISLEIFSIKVSAIALIDTKLPDGRPGYSFLIIISVEFFPIQLSFGFTLNGVGGICGIHRTINAEALRQGVYAGSLDSIMFPQDPVRNAPQLISDLSRIFPPAEGQFVFGPMAKIGWGTPTLVEISLGIIIELPDPIRIALLGQIAAMFPERDAAVVEIHIDFVALIDFGAKLLSLDATLRDSRIVVWTLTGDMALRLSWADPPNFAIALGGFHPHFPTPPGFPSLRRLSLALGAGDWIRISCQTYQALTSNSLQFGARAELYINAGVYVRGWIGFDALIIYSPFSFEVGFTAGLEIGVGDVSLAGVSLDGSLSGPNPFRVRGTATLSVLFFDISVDVDKKFGSEDQATLPTADPWPPLLNALKDPRNWAALPGAGTIPIATLSLPAGTQATVIDPAGKMVWRQTVAPLDRTLTRFASVATAAPVKYTVTSVTVGGNPATYASSKEFFAAAQFEDMSDADKLSRPSFESMQAGVEVASASVHLGPSIAAPLEYETEYVDAQHGPRLRTRFLLPLWMQTGRLQNSAYSQKGLNAAGTRAYAAPRKLSQSEEQYVVVSTGDLSVRSDVTAPTTKGKASQVLREYVASRPSERDTLQVVPLYELEEA